MTPVFSIILSNSVIPAYKEISIPISTTTRMATDTQVTSIASVGVASTTVVSGVHVLNASVVNSGDTDTVNQRADVFYFVLFGLVAVSLFLGNPFRRPSK